MITLPVTLSDFEGHDKYYKRLRCLYRKHRLQHTST